MSMARRGWTFIVVFVMVVGIVARLAGVRSLELGAAHAQVVASVKQPRQLVRPDKHAIALGLLALKQRQRALARSRDSRPR